MFVRVFSQADLIGTAELQVIDTTSGVMQGLFLPEKAYANMQGMVAHNFPNVNVQTESGEFITSSEVDIRDNTNKGEHCIIELKGVSAFFCEEPNQTKANKSRFLEPWETITISQKLAFEKELLLETGNFSSPVDKTNQQVENLHVLSALKCSAIAKYGPCDDVLFEIMSETKTDPRFVVVHLTWIEKAENNFNYPRTYLYKDFETFLATRMAPDHQEWRS